MGRVRTGDNASALELAATLIMVGGMSPLLRLPLVLSLALFLAACGRKEPAPSHPGGHVHVAPHGGTLIEIGEHAFNLELLRDAATGKLTAWVLDGHAENFVRLKVPAIEGLATFGAEKRPFQLKAVANPATGETAGDTSQFEMQADWLKTKDAFTVTIPALEIRGRKFGPLTANYPQAAK